MLVKHYVSVIGHQQSADSLAPLDKHDFFLEIQVSRDLRVPDQRRSFTCDHYRHAAKMCYVVVLHIKGTKDSRYCLLVFLRGNF